MSTIFAIHSFIYLSSVTFLIIFESPRGFPPQVYHLSWPEIFYSRLLSLIQRICRSSGPGWNYKSVDNIPGISESLWSVSCEELHDRAKTSSIKETYTPENGEWRVFQTQEHEYWVSVAMSHQMSGWGHAHLNCDTHLAGVLDGCILSLRVWVQSQYT